MDWVEKLIARGQSALAELYQLKYNAHDLRSEIQALEEDMATSKPRDEIITSHLRMAYDSVAAGEDKKAIFIWREQQALKVKISETISAELIKGKLKVTSTLKYARTFVSQIPCLY